MAILIETQAMLFRELNRGKCKTYLIAANRRNGALWSIR